MTEDLPTLDLPANTMVGITAVMKSLGLAADLINSALFMFILHLLPYSGGADGLIRLDNGNGIIVRERFNMLSELYFTV